MERRRRHRFRQRINSIRAFAGKHVAEAREWASSLGLRAVDIRKACLSFPTETAIGLDQHANLSDNALESLGEVIRQRFVKLASPTQSLLQLLVLLGRKNGGSRTIAILRLVSAHIRAVDIELAHSEGQYVIDFLWDMRNFYDSIKAHLLIG